jgi:phenylalanyl-tRNA synthetase alpha chain
MHSRSAEELSLSERKVLVALGKLGGKATLPQIADVTGLRGPVQLMNAMNWLKAKGYIWINERVVRYYEPLENAPDEFPERVLLRLLADGPLTLEELSLKLGDRKQLGVGIGWLKKKGYALIEGEKIIITPEGKRRLNEKDEEELLLEEIRKKGSVEENETNSAILRGLLLRKDFVQIREKLVREAVLLEKGREALAKGIELHEEISQLTPELLRTGAWRNFTLRPYNAEAPVPVASGARLHPLARAITEISSIFLSMGFTEIEDDYVQSAFWDMDVLFTPQDHPARDMQDTFYLSEPAEIDVETSLLSKVRRAHENGGNTGSTGWRYRFNTSESRKVLLRTHTTVATIRYLATHTEPPVKAYTVGRIFRHEAMDATHLSEFHQIEGVVMEKNASLDMLCGILSEFYRRMGMPRIRLRPGYFPYTEPSMEIDVQLGNRWIELGGSGIFRPEVLRPLGIRYPVLAWGLGLERLVILRYGLSDVRELYLTDISKLRKLPVL